MRVSALLLVILFTLSAQQDDDMPKRSDFISTVRTVIAPTTVTDRDGRFIDGLKVADFALFDNEKQQRIATDVVFQPISMVIAVQASSSVDEILPKIRKIGPELAALVLGPTGEVAVVDFDHRIQTIQDF